MPSVTQPPMAAATTIIQYGTPGEVMPAQAINGGGAGQDIPGPTLGSELGWSTLTQVVENVGTVVWAMDVTAA